MNVSIMVLGSAGAAGEAAAAAEAEEPAPAPAPDEEDADAEADDDEDAAADSAFFFSPMGTKRSVEAVRWSVDSFRCFHFSLQQESIMGRWGQ